MVGNRKHWIMGIGGVLAEGLLPTVERWKVIIDPRLCPCGSAVHLFSRFGCSYSSPSIVWLFLISPFIVTIDFIERLDGLTAVGGTQGRRHIQRAVGIVRFLDEHEFARRHLHIEGRRSLLETSQLLHSRIGRQVFAVTARVVGESQGGFSTRTTACLSSSWWTRS